ncbi:MAG: hypothetical protein WCR08_13495 [Gammaproteobacteria bacterium]
MAHIDIKLIVIFGRSEKFITLLKILYPEAKIHIIPWRASLNMALILLQQIKEPIDLLLICGYDFSSYSSIFIDYLQKNVYHPLKIIELIDKYCMNPNYEIIYIDTLNSSKKYTFSRYFYAKKYLASQLSTLFPFSKIVQLPTIYDGQYGTKIQGGLITKLVSNFLISLGIVKIITTSNLSKKIQAAIANSDQNNKGRMIKPRLISIPRNQFFDRILRILCG